MLKFSIVTPVLNRRVDIERMFEAVQAQSFVDFELIIVDNGSIDGTYEFVLGLEKRFEYVRVFLCKQKGLAFARNIGISNAIGDWIVLLDSDNKFICNTTLFKLNEIIDNDIGDNVLGIWTKAKTSSGKECSYIRKGCFNKELNFDEYVGNISGEFSVTVKSNWFKKNLYPEIVGAVTEFPDMVWFQLLRDGSIYVSDYYTQIYGTDSNERICSIKISNQRAYELTHNYFMILEKYSSELIKSNIFDLIVLKLYAYNRLSVLFNLDNRKYFKYLSFKTKFLILLLILLPKTVVRYLIEKYKEKTELK